MNRIGLQTLMALASVWALTFGWAAFAEEAWLNRESIQIERAPGEGAIFRCTVWNPIGRAAQGEIEVAIVDFDGNEMLRGRAKWELKAGQNACEAKLAGALDEAKLAQSLVRYDFQRQWQSEKGQRSLMAALAQLETRIVGYRDLQMGSVGGIRLVALNHATGAPIEGADVTVALASGNVSSPLLTAKTGAGGTLDARFDVPDNLPLDMESHLAVTVAAETLGRDELTLPVTLKRDAKILLTTDKPLYQPGQVIHMRTLSLAAGSLKPRAKEALVFEVMDGKGNKVFKRKLETDAFGIAAADFQLATEVNLGAYIVRASLGASQSEKQITVDRYVLPKFKVAVKTDKEYYLPGETLKGEIQADYFFGKPVAGGKVEVAASKFEIQFEEFAKLEGQLDASGHWSFELPLPAFFAGTPIEQGQASVRLEAVVTDTADHREEKVSMTPVAGAAMLLHAVPEGGTLAPGIKNNVYILAAYPDGTPAAGARLLVEAGQLAPPTELEADALGVATFALTPKEASPAKLGVRARDAQGRNAEQAFDLECRPGAWSLLVRTDKVLYRVGETLQAEVFASKAKGNVYFDLIRNGQTVMTRVAELENGHATLAFDLDAATAGSLVLQAYMFTPTTDLIRDVRRLYVNPADALSLAVALDKETYAPGEEAQVKFAVTRAGGEPVAAALGVSIVDESVFALQEIHPGLEKIYFTLEKEIMTPRFEIHGFDIEGLVKGAPAPGDEAPAPEAKAGAAPAPVSWSDQQQEAARVLLATAENVPDPPVRMNSFDAKRTQADEALAQRYGKDLERITRAVTRYLEQHSGDAPDDLLKALLREKYLRSNEILDPYGNPYQFDFSNVQGGGFFIMRSAGPDEVMGTADDLAPDSEWGRQAGVLQALGHLGGGGRRMLKNRVMMQAEMALPMAAPAPPQAAAEALAVEPKKAMAVDVSDGPAGDAGGAGGPAQQPVRLREYFPETLLFEPALITDAQGLATLKVPMADSITTWRMTAMASSAAGALGSKDSPMRVFQDFFVDLDLPVALTQHDQISIPVVLYNYLTRPQQVRLKFEVEPWFKLQGAAEQTIALASEEVKSLYFPIEVVELGKHRLTVYAYGEQASDAIRREIEVRPDGEEHAITFSDRLSGAIEHTVAIPAEAVPGASKILVRIYPGVFSQIVDGLDSMLQMPSGCFEQTSSITYPNILIVQYLKETKQINPEIQMKAEGFINAGYQRLLSYEVQGGGFSWFGDAPANKVLTAWGVKEFADMSHVHEVDPAVIERTRAWLAGLQEKDGSWKPDAAYLHEESWGAIQKSDVLVTAYIADALLGTDAKNEAGLKAIDYLKAHWQESKEPYVLALVANAFVSWNAKEASTTRVLDALYNLRQEDKDTVFWKSGAGTVTFAHGDSADIETTALATIALLKSGRYPEATTKALTYLIRKKSAGGHWGSTQATILALKALTLSLGSRTDKVNATIAVNVNGETASELKVTPDDSDVMRLVDLGEKTRPGNNTVALSLTGEGAMLYQVVGRYYTPWKEKPLQDKPMTITVEYDKRELAVNDIVQVKATVVNNRPGAAKMVVIDLGIPPGFDVMTPDLDALVQKGTIKKYELTGRQIIAYFEEIPGNGRAELTYSLRARFPLRAQTPQSRAYEYYNPEVETFSAPQPLVVQ